MSVAFTEYSMTAGLLIAFAALITGCMRDRKRIARVLRGAGLRRRHLAVTLAIVAAFVAFEIVVMKPTQLLFFDDMIYQGMAQQLLNTGQAIMCDYGTPATCITGEVFHEPIGLSFNFAIAFLAFGVHRSVAYGTELAIAAVAVLMTFFSSLLIFRDAKAAIFSEALLALAPVVLVWAMPTNSDMAVLAYSLVALFFVLVFMQDKHLWSFSNMLMSLALVGYMKVDALLYIAVFAAIYVILNRRGSLRSIKEGMKLAAKHSLDTNVLLVVLVFAMALAPAIVYAANELGHGDYGATGQIQNTCLKSLTQINVTGNTNLQNFGANVCANSLFWFDAWKGQYVIQPATYTVLAMLGALLLAITGRRRELAAIGVWFLAFFLLYTAFYAGSVIYGVDWRFMLSLMAQAAMLGGFAIACILETVRSLVPRRRSQLLMCIAAVAITAVLLYPLYSLLPQIAVNPSKIQQADDARFYEGFVYNTSKQIPASCLVYTYDPSLFTLNGRAAIQLGYIYNTSQYDELQSEYGCTVMDYGYWCHTPDNLCTDISQNFTTTPIINTTYAATGENYGFYYLHEK
jgi:hypothetical protein